MTAPKTVYRGYRYRLYPTDAQHATLRRWAGVVRFVYNLAVEQRERQWTYYRDNGTRLDLFQQSRELTQLRAEVDWIAAVPRDCEETALKEVDRAFNGYFRGTSGRPTYRRKGQAESLCVKAVDVRIERVSPHWSRVLFPKLGWLRFRHTRDMPGVPKTITATLTPLGWHISFICEFEPKAAAPITASIGIDRGVANALALSDGSFISAPIQHARQVQRRLKHAQRTLARCKRGSNRRAAAKRRVARLSAKIGRIRQHWCHETSRQIADNFGTVVVEDLNIKGMTASGSHKRGLNRSILEQGWGQIARLLDYKLDERGGHLVLVPAAYSSQTCSHCGTVDKASRKNQATFECRHCGFEGHADTNAAIVILRRNTAGLDVEGTRSRPGEASTGSRRMLIPIASPFGGRNV